MRISRVCSLSLQPKVRIRKPEAPFHDECTEQSKTPARRCVYHILHPTRHLPQPPATPQTGSHPGNLPGACMSPGMLEAVLPTGHIEQI